MPDLDQSDVERDAQAQFAEWLDGLRECNDDSRLQRIRYMWGPDARSGVPEGIDVVNTIDWIRAGEPDSVIWPNQ